MKKLIITLLAILLFTSCENSNVPPDEQELEFRELELKEKELELRELELKELELKQKEKELQTSNNNQSTLEQSKNKKHIAIINDPDGYTNVRSGMSTNHKIIDRLFEGEHYEVYPTSNSNWWRVNTQSNVQGYVHKSRIRIID